MRIAYLSPLPPARTGIAHYASLVLPALRQRFDAEAFASLDGYRRGEFDAVVYQLGNNPHHEWIYREALEHPGVAVLHDAVLHHLIVEMTLARGDVDGYVAALAASHGAAGAAWARGRAAGLHSEMGNFLLPASVHVANRSRSVIVHNRWAADLLRSFGVSVPIVVVPHPEPRLAAVDASARERVRRELGFAPAERVIGFFGFVTSAKRAEVVLQAFARARASDASLRLLIVGEPAPNIDPATLQGEGITVTGYVDDDRFDEFYAAADLLVNLRYPSAGESSGTLVRAFAAGKPVAVSNYAQFAEFPDACVTKIDLGENEVEQLARFFLDRHDSAAVAAAQRRWLDEHAGVDVVADGYARAINAATAPRVAAVAGSLPLFPRLTLTSATVTDRRLTIELRNDGDGAILSRTYDQPAYRVLAKLFDGGAELENRWIELPRDLMPGESISLSMPLFTVRGPAILRLYDAMESIPLVEPQPWASCEISA